MQLRMVLEVLRRHWAIIALTTVLGMGLGFAASVTATPSYGATSSVFVSFPSGNTPTELSQGSTFTQNQMQSYAELATMAVVLDKVVDSLDLNTTARDIAGKVSTSVSPDSTVMQIVASDPSPQEAAALANAVANQLGATARALSPKNLQGKPTVELTVVGPAVPPEYPDSPKTRRNVAAGGLVGMILGFGFALIRAREDTRIRSTADLAAVTAAPILASVIDDGASLVKGQPLSFSGNSVRSEEYRRLRANLQFLSVDRGPLALVITSSIPGEGKSVTALSLATACARAGDKVLLIDADLRKPSVAEYLGLEGSIGLTTVLTGRIPVDEAIIPLRNSYDVLLAGEVPPNPAELLGSIPMRRMVTQLRDRYDVILLDTPPLVPVVDAALLANAVSGAVLVARYDEVHGEQLHSAAEALDRAGARLLGLVFNGLERKGYTGYYGKPYGHDKPSRQLKRRRKNAVSQPSLLPPDQSPDRETGKADDWSREPFSGR